MIKAIINSNLGLTTAYLLTIILHEIAHYTMAITLGYDATLYHNMVSYPSIDAKIHEVLIAGIAPLLSLLLGVLFYRLSLKMKTNATSLFVLWLGLTGIITFFGYLMIAPLISVGDTGKVFSLLAIPMIVQIIIAIIAVVAITFILVRSASHFEKYAIEDFGNTSKNRRKWAISLILIPLLISIVIITLLQFPVPHIASILATTCAPFSIMAVFGTFIGSKKDIQNDINGISINKTISKPLIFLFIAAVIMNRYLAFKV